MVLWYLHKQPWLLAFECIRNLFKCCWYQVLCSPLIFPFCTLFSFLIHQVAVAAVPFRIFYLSFPKSNHFQQSINFECCFQFLRTIFQALYSLTLYLLISCLVLPIFIYFSWKRIFLRISEDTLQTWQIFNAQLFCLTPKLVTFNDKDPP